MYPLVIQLVGFYTLTSIDLVIFVHICTISGWDLCISRPSTFILMYFFKLDLYIFMLFSMYFFKLDLYIFKFFSMYFFTTTLYIKSLFLMDLFLHRVIHLVCLTSVSYYFFIKIDGLYFDIKPTTNLLMITQRFKNIHPLTSMTIKSLTI